MTGCDRHGVSVFALGYYGLDVSLWGISTCVI